MIKFAWMMLALLLAAEGSNLENAKTDVPQVPHLLFHKLFTPMKLVKAASFIHHHHSLTETQLTFLSAPTTHYRLMIVPLIPPGIIEADANIVVKMVVGVQTSFGQADSDPSFVISDGHHFVGVFTRDKPDYTSSAPCYAVEGTSGQTIGNRRADSVLPKPSESYYPGRFEIQLSLSDRWVTCFVPLDGGFSREMIYQNKLNPQNGLFLEIYRNDAQEKEGIKYIEVSILQEN